MTLHFLPKPLSILSWTVSLGIILLVGKSIALADGLPVNQVVEAIKSEINQARLARNKQDPTSRVLRPASESDPMAMLFRLEISNPII